MDDYTLSNDALAESWKAYVRGFAQWQNFVTLTFRDIVTRDQAEHQFRYLIQVLNRDLFGKHYTRIVGHCYCSYVVGFESQKRGALHMHVLFDKPINFNLVHVVWNKMAGFAWIKPVDDVEAVSAYVAKYVSKGGDLSLYKPLQVKEPRFQPFWYTGL